MFSNIFYSIIGYVIDWLFKDTQEFPQSEFEQTHGFTPKIGPIQAINDSSIHSDFDEGWGGKPLASNN